ncbi:hypothetical protein NC653_016586 [Populus alba x Populus x berolinensis]|uniref:Uncharacterized protein n=1 Tax=Populus alba x Populus x berolinensis TaxID=444605 RepID=A0AAD6VZW0_9ROSI|nr:hypothetical protein NC653_016586 [Populus alba x Populus x berolinensis]
MVPWHSDICRKFQKLKKKGEDVMLKDLDKRKTWRSVHCARTVLKNQLVSSI